MVQVTKGLKKTFTELKTLFQPHIEGERNLCSDQFGIFGLLQNYIMRVKLYQIISYFFSCLFLTFFYDPVFMLVELLLNYFAHCVI